MRLSSGAIEHTEERLAETAAAIPRDFKSLRELIVAKRAMLPKRLLQVADFAVDHPEEIAFARVSDLASQAGVQPSTFVRFAQTLGYSGFSDLQAVFRAHARQRWPDYRERLDTLVEAATEDTPAGSAANPLRMLHGFVHASRVSLDHLEQTIEAQTLQQAVEMLSNARSLFLAGTRRVYPVVVYLRYALRKLGLRAELLDDAGGNAERQAELLGPGDLVLAISFTPYAAATVDLATIAARRGAEVVAITDSPFSPLIPVASCWLEVAETDHAGFRTLSATLALASMLAVSVAERRARREEE